MPSQHTTQTKTSENDRPSQVSAAAKSSTAPAMHPTLHLQQQIGNQAVGRLIQAKLTVGEPNDVYEQEADRVAAEVVSQIHAPQNVSTNQTTSVQRQVVGNDEKELRMKPLIQCKSDMGGMAVSPEIESSIQQARGSGQPLTESIRTPMEQAFGADFSGVRVHTDEQSDRLNRSVGARAFTTGQDIFFRQGEYSPSSLGGEELIAHELTHVVQQNGSIIFNEFPISRKRDISLNRSPAQKSVSQAITFRDKDTQGSEQIIDQVFNQIGMFGSIQSQGLISNQAMQYIPAQHISSPHIFSFHIQGDTSIIQRAGGKAGVSTYFYSIHNNSDEEKEEEATEIEAEQEIDVQEIDVQEIEAEQVFEVVQPFKIGTMNGMKYILVDYLGEKGWIPYNHVKSIDLANELKDLITKWNEEVSPELTPNSNLTQDIILKVRDLKKEFDEFKDTMHKCWPDSYLYDFICQLKTVNEQMTERFAARSKAIIMYLFRSLLKTKDPSSSIEKFTSYVRNLNFNIDLFGIQFDPDIQGVWNVIQQVCINKKSWQEAYILCGNPTTTEDYQHREVQITSSDAYLSDNETTTPAPQSKQAPEGETIQSADKKDKLDLTEDEQTYIRHVRNTRPGEKSIYIDGEPSSDDIAQTELGDCFFLAVVASIADCDPEKIKEMMEDLGDGLVKVTFHFKDREGFFCKQTITINQDLVYKENKLIGNRFKIQPTDKSKWTLKKDKTGKRFVEEEKYYQTALWAPLLEKAFARFAEVHGEYGFAFSAQGSNQGGYDKLSMGGGVKELYSVFYGDQVVVQSIPMKETNSLDKLPFGNENYIKAIQTLLQFQKDRNKDSKDNNQISLLTAFADLSTIMERTICYLNELTTTEDYQQLPSETKCIIFTQVNLTIEKLGQCIDKAKNCDEYKNELIKIRSSVQNSCNSLLKLIDIALPKPQFPSPKMSCIMELLLDISGGFPVLGSTMKKHIYTIHEYAVLNVCLINNLRQKIDVDAHDSEAIKTVMSSIYLNESTVTLRNPNHANSPNLFRGDSPSNDAGYFTMKLSDFLRHFTFLTSGVVQKQSN
jgi:Domain of unknown function (DUF4157)/Calpain family cysteine protease